jgi:hypothetical protein
MADPRHQRTRSYRGRHRRPPRPERVAVPVLTLVAITVGGVAVANAVGSNSTHRAGIKTGSVGIVAPPTPAAQAVQAAPSPASSVSPAKLTIHHRHAYHHTKPDSVRIRDVSGSCYVQVATSSGKILVRRIAHRGDLIAFRRHGLDVTLGNAGAVRLVLDGHQAHRAGALGQVRRFTVR